MSIPHVDGRGVQEEGQFPEALSWRAMIPLLTWMLFDAASSPAPSAASSRPVPAVEYREAVMKSLAGHLRALVLIGGGSVGHPEQAALHAASIEETARILPTLFPPGSGPDSARTEALPTVWTDAEGFKSAVGRLQSESGSLLRAARGGDREALRVRVEAVSKACSACHDSYRHAR